jgi:hypothetical protein
MNQVLLAGNSMDSYRQNNRRNCNILFRLQWVDLNSRTVAMSDGTTAILKETFAFLNRLSGWGGVSDQTCRKDE